MEVQSLSLLSYPRPEHALRMERKLAEHQKALPQSGAPPLSPPSAFAALAEDASHAALAPSGRGDA